MGHGVGIAGIAGIAGVARAVFRRLRAGPSGGLPLAVGCACLLVFRTSAAAAQDGPKWAGFVEAAFPFFGSVVDGRALVTGSNAGGLTPRGVVLNPGQRCWAVFDVDLVRFGAMWSGDGVTPVSMSQGSYHESGKKAPEGDKLLPAPSGDVWLVGGQCPGVQFGDSFVSSDPRPSGIDPGEIGRGPLPVGSGRLREIEFPADHPTLRYVVGGVAIEETLRAEQAGGRATMKREVRVSPTSRTCWFMIGRPVDNGTHRLSVVARTLGSPEGGAVELQRAAGGMFVLRVPAWPAGGAFEVAVTAAVRDAAASFTARSTERTRWGTELVTRGVLARDLEAFVVDHVGLPLDNPWKRNVRLSDLAFRADGRAYAVTFDGDVWSIRGLSGDLEEVGWRRFTSGLHEPLGICVRDQDVFVHDRNGLWRIRDMDADGEADRHELHSAAWKQTAETREFASGLRLLPDGSFVIGKGGQRGGTLSEDSGCVLRITADGERVSVLGHGFRQPFIGVHPTTGLVSVSDQQGHHVPTTALYLLGKDAYHGFRPLILPHGAHEESIVEPDLWLPHAVNASGAGQVWLAGTRMGSLDGALIHLGYYRPELFLLRPNSPVPGGALAGVPLTRDLRFAPLAGAVGPLDGQLYVVGFQIWGTTAAETSGLARLRRTGGEDVLPLSVEAVSNGAILRFGVVLDMEAAVRPERYALETWNYRRSRDYGSPHFREDGTTGHDLPRVSRVAVSRDRRSVFLEVPDAREAMQWRVGWALRTASGTEFARSAYLSPRRFPSFSPRTEGFEYREIGTAIEPRAVAKLGGRDDLEEGMRVAELLGCVACHSTDGSTVGKTGPSWKGLWGKPRKFSDGSEGIADEAYLLESIRSPTAKILDGYQGTDTGMPSYAGVITARQEVAVVRYIQSLLE